MNGYMVESHPFRFLDGEMTRFRGHSKGHTGFVHSAQDLRRGGHWTTQAVQVYPAFYDVATDCRRGPDRLFPSNSSWG